MSSRSFSRMVSRDDRTKSWSCFQRLSALAWSDAPANSTSLGYGIIMAERVTTERTSENAKESVDK